MASKQQELKSVISVYGRADSSLDALARKIESFGDRVGKLGGAISAISVPIALAGKQSLELYTDYDDILRKIQAAGDYTEKQMVIVDAAARQAGIRYDEGGVAGNGGVRAGVDEARGGHGICSFHSWLYVNLICDTIIRREGLAGKPVPGWGP